MSFVPPKIRNTLPPLSSLPVNWNCARNCHHWARRNTYKIKMAGEAATFAKSVREGNADTVALAVPLLWETIFGHTGGDGR